ncbi:MAG: hydroxymethylbilane synthase [Gemmataceae bacterium]|nr:hydroxymethylbilane synthase [Gemmataceae bacterium]MCI0742350.1 hydroxymethylbilane synthase [Gemmataceae bacterium]
MLLRIGTRGSPLALWQANHVAGLLRAANHGLETQLVEIQTAGDDIRNVPLPELGGEGVFTKAIQEALKENRVDVAVHSLKDLPTVAVPGLVLAAVPPRGPTGDAFVSLKHARFDDLPQGAVVATGSLRRKAQVHNRRPDLKVVDIRGNVETRLRKLAEQELDATILAQAGLVRLGLQERIREILDANWMLPAVGQGALALECRFDDDAATATLQKIDDPNTHAAVLAERAFLRQLGGGCQVPIGAAATINDRRLTLRGAVLPPDGSRRVAGDISGPLDAAEALGIELAETVKRQGARALLGHP